jgi:hypothetical protein
LADDNYQHWRLQISLVLKAAKVWPNVSGAIPRPSSGTGADEWDATDVQAMAIIVTTLNQVNSNHVFACTTSKEMFDKLKSIHADSSVLNKQHTLSAFLNFKIDPEKTLVHQFTEVEHLRRSLQEMGVAIDEATAVTKIVSALPDDMYQSFKKAWDSVADTSQTMDYLLARLRKEIWKRFGVEAS